MSEEKTMEDLLAKAEEINIPKPGTLVQEPGAQRLARLPGEVYRSGPLRAQGAQDAGPGRAATAWGFIQRWGDRRRGRTGERLVDPAGAKREPAAGSHAGPKTAEEPNRRGDHQVAPLALRVQLSAQAIAVAPAATGVR